MVFTSKDKKYIDKGKYKMKLLTTYLFTLFLIMPVFADDCQVQGEKVQWLTDYCMYKFDTDDVLEIEACMAEDTKHDYEDDCAAKVKYKRKMCKIAIEEEEIRMGVQECLNDESFMGSTVKNSGIGK
jgi:hypothetical protein